MWIACFCETTLTTNWIPTCKLYFKIRHMILVLFIATDVMCSLNYYAVLFV